MEYIGEWMLHDMEEVGSTNDEVKALSYNITGEKVIISARRQTDGRGRRGRSWIGLDGNLFFSQGLECELKFMGALVFISTLSLWKTIRDLSPLADVKLKWPNDILVNDKKISGMLLEKGEGNYLIIGIGVNLKIAPKLVNMPYPCTSLSEEGIETERMEFLRQYIQNFNTYYSVWQLQGFEPIREEWLKHVKGLGDEIIVHLDNEDITGLFSGIDEQGALLLNQGTKISKIYAGDIFYPQRKKVVNE